MNDLFYYPLDPYVFQVFITQPSYCYIIEPEMLGSPMILEPDGTLRKFEVNLFAIHIRIICHARSTRSIIDVAG